MGLANDFLTSFFKEYPQAKSGKISMEELNRLMAKFQQQKNSTPLTDFEGLSPEQMSNLLKAPLATVGILQFSKKMKDHVDEVPLFKLSELLTEEIRNAGNLKLTAKGNLPVRTCELLYNQELIKWEYMDYHKKVQEDEVPYLSPLKHYLLDEGIIKKRNNALSLTKSGEKLMKGDKTARFIILLNYFTHKFHWGNFYGLEDGGRCGNFGWFFSLFLLSKYGKKPNSSAFYSLKLIRAFESELWEAHQKKMETKALNDYHFAYAIRFFECFANWFGLIYIERTRDYSLSLPHQLKITKSNLFDHLFKTATTG